MKTSIIAVLLFLATSASALDCISVPFLPSKLRVGLALVQVKVLKVYSKQGMDVNLISNLSNKSVPRTFYIDYSAVAYWDGDQFPEGTEWLLHLALPTKKSKEHSLPICSPRLRVSKGIASGWITGLQRDEDQHYQVKEIRAMNLGLEKEQ